MGKIHYLSVKSEVPATGYWDHAYLNDLLASLGEESEWTREVVVIPGAYQADSYTELNRELAKYEKICVFITSDEENKFDGSKLFHPDMILYSQYGGYGHPFPLGYAPGTREHLRKIGPQVKDLDSVFMGQVTHWRRKELAKYIEHLPNSYFLGTDGFSKGYSRNLYLEMLSRGKVAPCPTGAVHVDSFRLYEALEAGCVPIADSISPLKSSSDRFFERLFRDLPFPLYADISKVPGMVRAISNIPDAGNKVMAWWINKKYQIKAQLKHDLGLPKNDTVVVIPVSPIPSHPSTDIIDETIMSIRAHTDAPILVTIDGIREEQQHMAEKYREFTRQFIWKCNFEYTDVLPVIFSQHTHQVGMMRQVLKNVDMQFVLYVEHDTPLTPDRELPLEDCKRWIVGGQTNLIRFHFEAHIPEPHKHLMGSMVHGGAPLLKTNQWSQRPHIASTEYYRRILESNFSPEANTFIEDRMHSVCQVEPWIDHKLTIYHPSGDIKRSYHLDGRQGAEKYDKNLVY